ncbi:hypothetical protein CDD81_7460 [Ophiocordyceps australis]|uniref:FAD-binding domain-containing protein n=1 Tax=Ophiocordyceps australis TaxID=1399860 RepID=A0A2C5YA82_9HYPO|nr:hypothetical protein CDD81_7460 [Ophiocordyceps australis]
MQSEAPLRVLISGGGIAGPAIAFWLSRLGHACTIVERSASLRSQGQQIDIREQGVEVARRMGLLDHVRRCSVGEEGTEFVDVDGKAQAYFPQSPDGEFTSLTTEYEIMRGSLCRLLHEATKDFVTYKFGVTVDTFDKTNEGVMVSLSDGSTAMYDLLIGADGQGSRIRKKLLADKGLSDSIRSLGAFGGYYSIRRQARDDRNIASVCLAPKRRVMMTRWHSKTQGQAYLFAMSNVQLLREALKQGPQEQKMALKTVFCDAGWQATRLAEALDTASDFYLQEVVQVRSECWHQGRVVLLGDAGYCPSPFTGMGTTLALVGAYVLAGELARRPRDIRGAVEAYDKTLRPFVQDVQKLAWGMPDLIYQRTALQVWAMNMFLWLLSIVMPVLKPWLDLLPLREPKWKLPDYAELKVKTDSQIMGRDEILLT